QERRQQVVQRDEAGPLGDDVDEEDDAEAGPHLHRARAAEDEERAVDDPRDDEDVEHVDRDLRERPAREEVEQPFEHQLWPSSIRSRSIAWRVARTSWTRSAAAPWRAANRAAAIDAPIRASGIDHAAGAPRPDVPSGLAGGSTAVRNDLRLAPTSTGTPTARAIVPIDASTAALCFAFLANPRPGSITSDSR